MTFSVHFDIVFPMYTKRILILALIAAFAVPWFAPLAKASGTQGEICTLPSTECAHDETCPLKQSHGKDMGHSSHNTPNKKDAKHNECEIFIECHTNGEGSALLTLSPETRFATNSGAIITATFDLTTDHPKSEPRYTEYSPSPPVRPPALT